MSDERSYASIASTTSIAKLYPHEDDKEDWVSEADEADLSLSKYLYNLIQEARFMRHQGQLKLGDRRRVEELQDRIRELEEQQEKRPEPTPDTTTSIATSVVESQLTQHYQPFDEVVKSVLSSTEFRGRVQRAVETELYSLGYRGRVAYRRGHGWKQLQEGE
jgi:hypothetical protein